MDIGAGSGYFSFRLAKAGAHVIAADVNEEFQNHIREKIRIHQLDSLGIELRKIPYDGPSLQDEEVDKVLKSLASKSPIGMKIGKEAFYAMADMPFEEALDFLSGKIAEVAATEDAREGITAFIEKRKPVFKGK